MYYGVLVDHSAYIIYVLRVKSSVINYHTIIGYVLNLSDCSANSQCFFSNVYQP